MNFFDIEYRSTPKSPWKKITRFIGLNQEDAMRSLKKLCGDYLGAKEIEIKSCELNAPEPIQVEKLAAFL